MNSENGQLYLPPKTRVAVVVAQFNRPVTDMLAAGCSAALSDHGLKPRCLITASTRRRSMNSRCLVPGSFRWPVLSWLKAAVMRLSSRLVPSFEVKPLTLILSALSAPAV